MDGPTWHGTPRALGWADRREMTARIQTESAMAPATVASASRPGVPDGFVDGATVWAGHHEAGAVPSHSLRALAGP